MAHYLIQIHKIPSDLPHRYASGFVAALNGWKNKEGEDLANAYIAGYEHGSRIKDHKEEMPEWASKIES